jgi:hypothetical protein
VAFKLAEAFVDITGRDSALNGVLGRVHGRISASTIALGTAAGNLLTGAIGGAVGAIGGLYDKVIVGASDLSETMSKVNVVFGSAAGTITGTADELARLYGLPRGEILDAAAGIGLVGKASGQTEQQAASLGSQMARLAADASSFYNIPLPEALEKIKSGLVGEAEPLRALGVLLSDAAMKQEGLNLGLIKGKEEMTEGQKVQARASIIARQLGAANGDLARTSGGYANQAREFGGGLSNMFAELGMKLLPAVTAIMKGANTLIQDLGAAVAAHMPEIEAFASKLAQLGPVIGVAWKELPTAIGLVGSVIADTFTNAITVARNLLVGLAKFAADIFQQIASSMVASLENAAKDFLTTKAGAALVATIETLTLGQANVMDGVDLSTRRQAGRITPNLGLLGNPLEGTGWSQGTQDRFNFLSDAAGGSDTMRTLAGKADPSGKLAAEEKRKADAQKIYQEQLAVQQEQLATLKKILGMGPRAAVAS